MPWTLTDDVELYAEHVWALLARDPVLHTLPLTVIETVRTGHRWSPDPVVFGWCRAGSSGDPQPRPVIGAVCMTPPFDLLLPEVPPGTMDDLISTLREAGIELPGVRGESALVAEFSARWRAGTPIGEVGGERQRLYRLDRLMPPAGVPGRARRATVGDLDVVTELWNAFQLEADRRSSNIGAVIRGRIDAGLVWLWERDGVVVSLAARNAIAAGVARVGPVYTPPEHRRNGYAAAVTSACSQDALDCSAGDVALFTDLDNPTSNSVYQAIGYRAVCDFQTVSFA